MKCFVGIVVPKEQADMLWTMQTRAGALLAKTYGNVPFSQGSAPLHIRVAEPFEAERYGGLEKVRGALRQVAIHHESFTAVVQGTDSNGARDIHATVWAPEIKELHARLSACLGLGSPRAVDGSVARIRLAHDLPDQVFDAAERAFSLAYNEQREKGCMPLALEVGSLHLFSYGPREWGLSSTHALKTT